MSREFEPIIRTPMISPHVLGKCDEVAEMENRGEGWGVMHRGYEEYNKIYRKISGKSLDSFIRMRSLTRKSTTVLDLMGYGQIATDMRERHIPVSWGYSVSLGYPVEHFRGKRFAPHDNDVNISGNVLDVRTWDRLHEDMENRSVDKFALGIWMPIAGLERRYVTGSIDVYNNLMERAFDLISDNNGVLLAQIPGWIHLYHEDSYRRWIHDLEAESNPWERQFCRFGRDYGGDNMILLQKSSNHPFVPRIIE